MNRIQAEMLMKSREGIEKYLGEIDKIISDLSDEKEKQEFIESLGQIMLILYRDFVVKICKQYPDMDPDME